MIYILPTPGLEERKDRREASTDKVLPAPGARGYETPLRRRSPVTLRYSPWARSLSVLAFKVCALTHQRHAFGVARAQWPVRSLTCVLARRAGCFSP